MSSFGFDAKDFPSGIKTMETYWNPKEYCQQHVDIDLFFMWIIAFQFYQLIYTTFWDAGLLTISLTWWLQLSRFLLGFWSITPLPFRREKMTCWTEILPLWSIKTELNWDCTDCKKKGTFNFNVSQTYGTQISRGKKIEPWNSYLPVMIQRCSTARFFFFRHFESWSGGQVKLLSWTRGMAKRGVCGIVSSLHVSWVFGVVPFTVVDVSDSRLGFWQKKLGRRFGESFFFLMGPGPVVYFCVGSRGESAPPPRTKG